MSSPAPATPTGAAALVAVCATSLFLAGCGQDVPDQVTDVRWQVTAVGDSAFDAAAQSRSWIVLGASTATGAVGCVRFTGTAAWSGSERSDTLTLSDLETTTDGDCSPGDRYNADLVDDVLRTPGLRWTYDDKGQMRHLRLWVDGSPEHGISFAG